MWQNTRKKNQTNEIYFSSHFNTHTIYHAQTVSVMVDGGGAGGFSSLQFLCWWIFSFQFFYRFSYMFTLAKQTKSNQCIQKNIRYLYTLCLTHTHTAIEMRCKQSDIFAKFMYLRHWVILSLFGEMCTRTYARTHTRIFICVTSALSTWSNDPNKRLRETRSRKNLPSREREYATLNRQKNLFWCWKKVLIMCCQIDVVYHGAAIYSNCHSYFVDWLTFYAIPIPEPVYMCVHAYLVVRSFVFLYVQNNFWWVCKLASSTYTHTYIYASHHTTPIWNV